ncbi:acyl-CoA thioesterase [Aquipuribacter nitratireducens]|uniref:Acyl-CoA thioesterase n=1 Tax=Aquipuribacter nitratireducens TaxID=650104 RepID=A0ABW0GLT9_9MICO
MPVVTVPVAMRWSDMDAYGHVNNTDFMRYTEQARIEALALVKSGPDTGTLVVRHEVEYRVPLEYHRDGVLVDIWVTRIGGAGFDLAYEVATTHAGERVVHAVSASTMVMYSFSRATPRRIEPAERELLESLSGPPVQFRRPSR